jgi:transposase InsO family protein
MKFFFIAAKASDYPVAWMCRRLEVSCSGFYRWSKAEESPRAHRDKQLGTMIRALHAATDGTYGSPRITRELKADGEAVGRKRVARVMRENGLSGQAPRRFRRTTDSKHDHPIAENIVARDFNPEAPNCVWAADITYVRTWAGWLYLAVVIDLFSRRVIGWAIADHMRTELVLDALKMAFDARRPGEGLVHHSDRGSQYASQAYRDALREEGSICSMSRKGDCWDNAVVESFFGTLKQELIHRYSWPTKQSAIEAIGEYIERFYNTRRRHSSLGYVSPLEYEMVSALRALAA